MTPKKKGIVKEVKLVEWKTTLLVILPFIAYYPSLNHDFVNWDDIVYIMNNDLIKSFDADNLTRLFSSFFMGNYHPITLLSFMADYHLFKFAAPGYHFHNLILHIINGLLVYAFIFYLFKRNRTLALTVALIFALHPMHVESVAWVSERKDLLYTTFFILALISYLFFILQRKRSLYILTLALFVLSCLAKAQAVTLPVVLLLIDYVSFRKITFKVLSEKIPFFILSAVFGTIAIFAQKQSGYVNPIGIEYWQSFFYAPYGLALYLLKFILPVNQTAVYEYPITPESALPWFIYLSPVVLIALLAITIKIWKKYPGITFGMLFFTTTIFPVLQFLPVGGTVIAERYTYIPYIGLGLVVALLLQAYMSKLATIYKYLPDILRGTLLLIMIFLTYYRTQTWENSISLWTDVINKNPQCLQAYNNRAFMYFENQDFDKALNDLTKGISLDPQDKKGLNFYASRALIYKQKGVLQQALQDFTLAIRFNPQKSQNFLDRGILYTDYLARYDSGISDFKHYLAANPEDQNGINDLGIAYYKNNNFDSARVCFLKILKSDSTSGNTHKLLANIYYLKKDYSSAYIHSIRAQQYGAQIDSTLMLFLVTHVNKSASIPVAAAGQ